MGKRNFVRDTAIFVVIVSSLALAGVVGIAFPLVLIFEVPSYDGETGRLLSKPEVISHLLEMIAVGVTMLIASIAILRSKAGRKAVD